MTKLSIFCIFVCVFFFTYNVWSFTQEEQMIYENLYLNLPWEAGTYQNCTQKNRNDCSGNYCTHKTGTSDEYALDFGMSYGTEVKASDYGVAYVYRENSTKASAYGNHVKIDHGYFYTLYAHLSSIEDGIDGYEVRSGDKIGEVGKTGFGSNPHLHFGLYQGNAWEDGYANSVESRIIIGHSGEGPYQCIKSTQFGYDQYYLSANFEKGSEGMIICDDGVNNCYVDTTQGIGGIGDDPDDPDPDEDIHIVSQEIRVYKEGPFVPELYFILDPGQTISLETEGKVKNEGSNDLKDVDIDHRVDASKDRFDENDTNMGDDKDDIDSADIEVSHSPRITVEVAGDGQSVYVKGDGSGERFNLIENRVTLYFFLDVESENDKDISSPHVRQEYAKVNIFVRNIPPAEREALVALYDSTNGSGWTNNSNWKTDSDPCSWYGVSCSDGHVVKLNLNMNQLTGPIPPEIGNLTNLTSLNLANSQLSGAIPSEIWNLTKLEKLILGINHLTGTISKAIGNLISLKHLFLYSSQLTGPIPSEIWNLTNLTELSLKGNFTVNSIPQEIANLRKLNKLLLWCGFTGQIPPEIWNLTNLKSLYLFDTAITGTLSPEIGNLISLKDFALESRQLTGPIPPEIWNLTNLEFLRLQCNFTVSSIPPEIGNLTELRTLYLWSCKFTGPLPKAIGNLTNLKHLDLQDNQLSGEVPSEIGELTNLMHLDLSYNMFTKLPSKLSNNVSRFNVSNNNLSFESLEPFMDRTFEELFSYSPQAKVEVSPSSINLPEGDTLTLSVNVGGENNLYQWYKNGTAVSSLSSSPEFSKPNVSIDDSGTYICEITNSIVENLVLNTEDITVSVSGENDPANQPQTVSGTVWYASTRVPGIKAELWSGENILQTVYSDSNGDYRFDNVISGEYGVRVYGPTDDYVSWSETSLQISDSDVIRDLSIMKDIKLISPENTACITSNQPTLVWEPNADASRYGVQVHVTSTWDLVIHDTQVTGTSYTFSEDLVNGETYTWQIDAYSDDRPVGSTMRSYQFTIEQTPVVENDDGYWTALQIITDQGPVPDDQVNSDIDDDGRVGLAEAIFELQSSRSASSCGAYVAPGVWKKFDCYNLAAIGKTTGDDPFTPSWRLIGGYWQWGRKGPNPSQWYDTNTEHFAHGPTGPGAGQANEGEIDGWSQIEAPDGAWSDSYKTVNDPCPDGYRVPTESQWEGIDDNNTQSVVGTWSSSATNYSSARFFGDDLMLPAAGGRDGNIGELSGLFSTSGALSGRGGTGYYWSSSESSSDYVWSPGFSSGYTGTGYDGNRRNGYSVRCISE